MPYKLTPHANKVFDWAAGYRTSNNNSARRYGARAANLVAATAATGGVVDLATGTIGRIGQALAKQTTDRLGWTEASAWTFPEEASTDGDAVVGRVVAGVFKVINPDMANPELSRDGMVSSVAKHYLTALYRRASDVENQAGKFFAKRTVVVIDITVMTLARTADLLVAVVLTLPAVALTVADCGGPFPKGDDATLALAEKGGILRHTFQGYAGVGKLIEDIAKDLSRLIYADDAKAPVDPTVPKSQPAQPKPPAQRSWTNVVTLGLFG